jgi:hypothetical protein
MTDTRKYVQAQSFSLAGAGAILGATSITLKSFAGIDGTPLTMTDFGTQGEMTLEPGNGTLEESIIFTGVVQNANGTATLTGVSTVLFIDPYTTASGLAKTHAGSTEAVISNTSKFYSDFANKYNDETISNEWIFTLLPRSNGGNATDSNQLITYAQALALATGTASINRVVVGGNAGATVSAGQSVYLDTADNEWKLTDADLPATVNGVMKGIAQGAGTDGNPITNGVLLFGVDSNQSGLTPGAIQYFSDTAGALSETPGTVEVTAGQAKSATEIIFFPSFNQQLTEDQQDALVGDNGTPSASNLYMTQSGFQRGQEVYAADAQGSDTYVITLSPVPAAYVTGMTLRFKANTANTGTATLNVNGLGAITIVKGVSTAIVTGDILASQIAVVIYNGTNFVLQNPQTVSLNVYSRKASTLFETSGRFTVTNSVGSTTFNTSGASMVTANGGVAAGSTNVVCLISPNNTVFLNNPVFTCSLTGGSGFATSGAASVFVGLGAVTVAATGHTFTTRHVGFKLLKTSNVVTLYATQADGTTETASSALTTITNGDTLDLIVQMTSNTSVSYFFSKNGAAYSTATILTNNIPAGSSSDSMQFSASSDNTVDAFTLTLASASYEK